MVVETVIVPAKKLVRDLFTTLKIEVPEFVIGLLAGAGSSVFVSLLKSIPYTIIGVVPEPTLKKILRACVGLVDFGLAGDSYLKYTKEIEESEKWAYGSFALFQSISGASYVVRAVLDPEKRKFWERIVPSQTTSQKVRFEQI